MSSRRQFIEKIGNLDLSRAQQAIALLWYYRQTQTFDERTASELAEDLFEEGLGKPNVTQLHKDLLKAKETVKGKRQKTFQLNVKHLSRLNTDYENYLTQQRPKVKDVILPDNLIAGTRKYLEEMVREINGAFEAGFYNSSAVMLRRLMESLIIEAYIKAGITSNIKNNNVFLMLDGLITNITSEPTFNLGRSSLKTMKLVKELGDTAAHDRTYLTQPADITDNVIQIRRLMSELLQLAGIVK